MGGGGLLRHCNQYTIEDLFSHIILHGLFYKLLANVCNNLLIYLQLSERGSKNCCSSNDEVDGFCIIDSNIMTIAANAF